MSVGAKDLANLWRSVATSEQWQCLFLALGMQDELDAPFLKKIAKKTWPHGSAGAERDPATPVREKSNKKYDLDIPSPSQKCPLPDESRKCRPVPFGQAPKQDNVLKAAVRTSENSHGDEEPSRKSKRQKISEKGPLDIASSENED